MAQHSGFGQAGNIEPINKHQRRDAARPGASSTQPLELHHADLGLALYQKRLKLSLSQLMGCDYIFIEAGNCPEFFTDQRLRQTLHELHDLLELSPHQTSFIGVTHESNTPQFIRYDLLLDEHAIVAVTPSRIDHPEQQDYINMLWGCSSSY